MGTTVKLQNIIKSMLSSALKGNSYLKFAVLTGSLRIAKESIFTGLNNLYVDSISNDRFDEYFGFTDSEINKLLEDTGLTGSKTAIKELLGNKLNNLDKYKCSSYFLTVPKEFIRFLPGMEQTMAEAVALAQNALAGIAQNNAASMDRSSRIIAETNAYTSNIQH